MYTVFLSSLCKFPIPVFVIVFPFLHIFYRITNYRLSAKQRLAHHLPFLFSRMPEKGGFYVRNRRILQFQ